MLIPSPRRDSDYVTHKSLLQRRRAAGVCWFALLNAAGALVSGAWPIRSFHTRVSERARPQTRPCTRVGTSPESRQDAPVRGRVGSDSAMLMLNPCWGGSLARSQRVPTALSRARTETSAPAAPKHPAGRAGDGGRRARGCSGGRVNDQPRGSAASSSPRPPHTRLQPSCPPGRRTGPEKQHDTTRGEEEEEELLEET